MTEPSEVIPCFFCEGEVSPTAKKCRHCGEWLTRDCSGCGLPLRFHRAVRGLCAKCEGNQVVPTTPSLVVSHRKSRGLAAVLALFFGGLGFHKFYLGRVGWGVIYVLFFWTFIPVLAGLFEGLTYALTSEESFQRKYGSQMLVPSGSVAPHTRTEYQSAWEAVTKGPRDPEDRSKGDFG